MTLGGGGSTKCHPDFFAFWYTVLDLFGSKTFVTKQVVASKDTFFLIHLIFQSKLGLQISHQKLKNVTHIIWMALNSLRSSLEQLAKINDAVFRATTSHSGVRQAVGLARTTQRQTPPDQRHPSTANVRIWSPIFRTLVNK